MNNSRKVSRSRCLRSLLALEACLVCLVITPHPAAADETPRRTEQQAETGPRTVIASGLGLGLDMIQRRAVNDSWRLYSKSEYARSGPDVYQVEAAKAVAKARKQRQPGEPQTAVDIDEDGKADWWVFFSGDAPVVAESDRYRTGCRDLRVDLRQKPAQITVFGGWVLEPPVPLDLPDNSPIDGADLYDWSAVVSRSTKRISPAQELALQCFPALHEQLSALAKKTGDDVIAGDAIVKRLSFYSNKAKELYPGMVEIHRREDLAGKLRLGGGVTKVDYRPFDLDGAPGNEVAVGFAPWGIDSIEFYKNGWKGGIEPGPKGTQKQKDFLAQVFFHRDTVVRIDLEGRRYFSIGVFWARVKPEARQTIAKKCLLPGYRDFRAGNWYQAVSQWRKGVKLAGLIGDFRLDQQNNPTKDLDMFSRTKWNFAAEDLHARDLLLVARAIAFRSEFPSFSSLARASAAGGRFEDALELHQLSLCFADKGEKILRKVNTLEAMSAIYRRLGNYDRAIESLFKSLDLESSLGYASDVVKNLKNLMRDPRDPASVRLTMQIRSRAMAVNRACKLATIATLYADLGERKKAQLYLAQAERLAKPLGHKYIEADLLNLKAKLDMAEGRWDISIQRLLRALEIAKEHVSDSRTKEHRPEESDSDIAAHQFTISRPRSYYCIDMVSDTHPLSYQALSAGMIGEAYLQWAAEKIQAADGEEARKLLVQAKGWQSKALQWYQKANDSHGVLVTQLRLGTIAAIGQEYGEALELAALVKQRSRQMHLFETSWRALALEGAVYRSRNQTREAIDAYEQAAKTIESLRARIHSEPVRRAFFGSKIGVYEELALLYFDARDEQAGLPAGESDLKVWQCMERAKARTLLDIVAGQPLKIKGEKVAQVKKDYPLLFQQMRGGAALTQQSDSLLREDEDERLRAAIAERPLLREIVSLRCVNPVDLKAVAALLEPDQLLIEYFATSHDLLAAVISRHDLKIVKIAGYGCAKLQEDVERFRQTLQDPMGKYEPMARHLYHRLLEPCLAGKQDVRRLCIVPGGALHYLPFGALVLPDGRFLIEHVPVSYAPSASALVYSVHRKREREKDWSDQTLVVADPLPHLGFEPLPGAADEGEAILNLAQKPKRLLSGKTATESRVAKQLPAARYFHFAGHTHLPFDAPMRAGLLCTEDVDSDGRFEVRDVFGLNLCGCEMVVLSACETRLGRYSRGDEIVGLERAFLRAGVPTMVTSLWKIDDASTNILMVEFYRRLWSKENKAGKLESLRQAQLAMLRGDLQTQVDQARRRRGPALGKPERLPEGGKPSPSTRHPCYWAAFIVSGDWR